MATLVAGLHAILTPNDPVVVLSIALSEPHDPQCVVPAEATWFRPPKTCNHSFREFCSMNSQSATACEVPLPLDMGVATVLQRARYSLNRNRGWRLKEDYHLMSRLTETCGLQEEMRRNSASSSTKPRSADRIFRLWPENLKADLTIRDLER